MNGLEIRWRQDVSYLARPLAVLKRSVPDLGLDIPTIGMGRSYTAEDYFQHCYLKLQSPSFSHRACKREPSFLKPVKNAYQSSSHRLSMKRKEPEFTIMALLQQSSQSSLAAPRAGYGKLGSSELWGFCHS